MPRMTSNAAASRYRIALRIGAYQARTLTPADARDAWARWFADPALMQPLNMPVRTLSKDELKQFIASFDGLRRKIAGIYERASGDLVCAYFAEFTPQHRLMRVSFVNGDLGGRSVRAMLATQVPMISHLFDKHHAEKVIAHVNVENASICRNVERLGFRLEGVMKGQVVSIVTGERLDQNHYGVLKDEWVARHGEAHAR